MVPHNPRPRNVAIRQNGNKKVVQRLQQWPLSAISIFVAIAFLFPYSIPSVIIIHPVNAHKKQHSSTTEIRKPPEDTTNGVAENNTKEDEGPPLKDQFLKALKIGRRTLRELWNDDRNQKEQEREAINKEKEERIRLQNKEHEKETNTKATPQQQALKPGKQWLESLKMPDVIDGKKTDDMSNHEILMASRVFEWVL